MKVIVGLGNPGAKYETTRHNVGFLLVDQLIDHWGATGPTKKYEGEIYQAVVPGYGQVLLVKPQTFMNLSGKTVGPLMNFYKIQAEDLLVAYDELDLPPMVLKLKVGGGTAGHNGLKSIDEYVGSENRGYHRLRIGIGKSPYGKGADHVLSAFNDDEWALLGKTLETGVKAVETWILRGMKQAMNEFNKSDKE